MGSLIKSYIQTFYSEKKNVLSNRPKTDMVWIRLRRCFGSEFHVIGPATEKARRPCELNG